MDSKRRIVAYAASVFAIIIVGGIALFSVSDNKIKESASKMPTAETAENAFSEKTDTEQSASPTNDIAPTKQAEKIPAIATKDDAEKSLDQIDSDMASSEADTDWEQ